MVKSVDNTQTNLYKKLMRWYGFKNIVTNKKVLICVGFNFIIYFGFWLYMMVLGDWRPYSPERLMGMLQGLMIAVAVIILQIVVNDKCFGSVVSLKHRLVMDGITIGTVVLYILALLRIISENDFTMMNV